MSQPVQFCTFYIEDNLFGIEVLKVQEVLHYQDLTKVPMASPIVRGLLNLRGHIVTTIDMRQRLHLPPHPQEEVGANVVTQIDGGLISLWVDRISDVVDVTVESFESTPSTVQTHLKELVAGVYKLKNQLLLVLDLDRIMTFETATA